MIRRKGRNKVDANSKNFLAKKKKKKKTERLKISAKKQK